MQNYANSAKPLRPTRYFLKRPRMRRSQKLYATLAPTTTSTTQTGITLAELTPTQNGQMCQEILLELLDTIVTVRQGQHLP